MMIFPEKGLCKRACNTFLRKNHRMAELLTWKKPRPALWDEADSPWYHPDSAWFICGTLTSVTGLPVLHYLDPFRTGCSRVNLQKFPSEGLSAGEPSLCHTGTLLYCLCHCVSHMVDGSTFPLVCQVSPGQRQNQHQSCTQRSFPPKPSNIHCPRIISVKFQRNFLSLSWHIQPFMASSVYRQE